MEEVCYPTNQYCIHSSHCKRHLILRSLPTFPTKPDEVNALVMDMGTTWTRAGYAGEDTPKAIFPTWVGYTEEDVEMAEPTGPDDDIRMADTSANGEAGPATVVSAPELSMPGKRRKYYVGDGQVNVWRSGMEIMNPLKDGLGGLFRRFSWRRFSTITCYFRGEPKVEDWEAVEQIWNYAFQTRLRVDTTEHPLLCTEPAWNVRENREKMAELAFEKYGFPAFYLAKDAVMTAFAAGRATALVLDSGGGMTSAVPVYDGYVLKKGILRQPLGGDFISEQIAEQFKRDFNIIITPQYLVEKKNFVDVGQPADVKLRDRPGTTESYHRYQQMVSWVAVVEIFLTETDLHGSMELLIGYLPSFMLLPPCYVEDHHILMNITTAVAVRPQKPFEFPDGYNYNFGPERYRAPEIMFQPREFIFKRGQLRRRPAPVAFQQRGRHRWEYALARVYRAAQLRSAASCARTAISNIFMFPHFSRYDILFTQSKMKIHAAGNQTERKCSSWLGGSVLASLGTFHQLWVSKKEYEENGASIVEKKCQ
ncbi:actin-domain-containing protein [Jimgerdemannia flammicorona]|uniref:Actin-domain-containing protein n=1 Tax=Jimgerdemannia flammicorona TaxID=994334 RepID=A0A433D2S0_9FUNG|nr:actin-domain-containing protein [Jimgerdemannia flammicorona]